MRETFSLHTMCTSGSLKGGSAQAFGNGRYCSFLLRSDNRSLRIASKMIRESNSLDRHFSDISGYKTIVANIDVFILLETSYFGLAVMFEETAKDQANIRQRMILEIKPCESQLGSSCTFIPGQASYISVLKLHRKRLSPHSHY